MQVFFEPVSSVVAALAAPQKDELEHLRIHSPYPRNSPDDQQEALGGLEGDELDVQQATGSAQLKQALERTQ